MDAAERLSAVDRAWLLMDRPTNPMSIVGLLLLERPLTVEQFRALITERFLRFERFRCVPALHGGSAEWTPYASFDIRDHVFAVALPAPAGERELADLVGELASSPLNPARPLWSFHVLEQFAQGGAIIVRIHHCYADGMALVQVLLSLGDSAEGSGATQGVLLQSSPPDAAEGGMWPPMIGRVLREGSQWLEKGLHLALHPGESQAVLSQSLQMAGELARVATLSADPQTHLKRPLSGARQVAWAQPVSLAEVKTISKVLGCTVNDVLVASLAGALGRYLSALGDDVRGRSIRATVPVDLRPAGAPLTLGNQFGLLFLDLPVGIGHPLERLYAVHTFMQGLKHSPQALVVFGLLLAVGSLPAAVEEPVVELFSSKASLVASNLAGPRESLSLCGVAISRLLFWVPQSGSVGTGVSMLTYNGQVQFGVIADRNLVPHPAELVELIVTEFERLVYLVLLGGASLSQ